MSLAVRIPTRFRRGRKHRSPFRLDETKKEWVGMQTTLTAKLKLVTTPEQFRQLRLTQLAYRDALNQASQHAFAHGKTSKEPALAPRSLRRDPRQAWSSVTVGVQCLSAGRRNLQGAVDQVVQERGGTQSRLDQEALQRAWTSRRTLSRPR
jgi:hypothetical protein